MNIGVLLRATEVAPNSELQRLGICDQAAMRTALSLRQDGDKVIALSVHCRTSATGELALSMGADLAHSIVDAGLEDCDYFAYARALAAAAEKHSLDLILCGDRSEDHGQGIVGPAVAEWLAWPHLTAAEEVERYEEDGLRVARRQNGRLWAYRVATPCVLSVLRGAKANSVRIEGAKVESGDVQTLGIDPREFRHRSDCLGRIESAAPSGPTLAKSAAELVEQLKSEKLL